MSKQKQLGQIKQSILDANLTPKLKKGATQLVFGHGNPDSEIMFIGEAPGKNEDLQGKPFVGAAGKLLEEMLEGIGMERADVYISNIVKYRPPSNRDPSPDEKNAFWPYLIKEIATVQPKIIATLGRHSMEYFLPKLKISQCHGQPKRIKMRFGSLKIVDSSSGKANNPNYENLVILPLFHPAAALYNGSMKQTLVEDFNSIPEIINIINSKKEKVVTNEKN